MKSFTIVAFSLLSALTHGFHLSEFRNIQKRSDVKIQVDDFQGNSLNNTIPWPKEKITYAVLQGSNVLSQKDIQKNLREAFDTWSAQIPREFVEVNDEGSANIKIKFVTGNHGDTQPFVKNRIMYAHADTSGILHFNDDTIWKSYENNDKIEPAAIDFYWVALHELGHVLGLGHNLLAPDSIMKENYKNSVDARGFYLRPKLDPVDIENIRKIYGAKTDRQSRNGALPECSEYKENTDIIGNDLTFKPGQPQHCCGFCRVTKECEAFIWNNHNGGTCWLKTGSKITNKKDGFYMGTI